MKKHLEKMYIDLLFFKNEKNRLFYILFMPVFIIFLFSVLLLIFHLCKSFRKIFGKE